MVGNATARTVSFAFRPEEGFAYYPDSNWYNMLWVGGYEFLDPPPQITADGVVPSPSDGARKLNSKIAFLYPATGVTPAMCMRLTGIGSQYLMAVRGSDGEYLDGGRNYRLTLPPDIPESRFWSVDALRPPDPVHAPDRPTEAGPRQPVGQRSRPTPTGRPTSTSDRPRPKARPTTGSRPCPGKGWWMILRLYSPEASFFDKTWQPTRDRTDLRRTPSLCQRPKRVGVTPGVTPCTRKPTGSGERPTGYPVKRGREGCEAGPREGGVPPSLEAVERAGGRRRSEHVERGGCRRRPLPEPRSHRGLSDQLDTAHGQRGILL